MTEISKAYEPGAVEDRWYEFWVKQGCFTADPARVSDRRPAYSIVIPPPNVTGMLHMGHVLNNTIQDILSRKARMDGKEVLWLPGTDHAGIATEGMVAKQIRKEEKKSKQEIGRDEFIRRVWTWKEKHGGIIIQQLKKLGCSCDWTRERFTMDPGYVQNVQRVFVDLYKKGLIYRGKRMVNWCPATQTALSDEEVEMKPQKGFLYHFKVEVAEAPGTWLTIATTRPETIPGDTAVAVNPRDPRYAHLIGKHIVRPLPHELPQDQKRIPIIGDEHVDFAFGTGVLKVTPAHDKADFEICQRITQWANSRIDRTPFLDEVAAMKPIDIMHPDGTMNALAGAELNGLERFKARKAAVEKLRELGLLGEEKPYENNVGFSQRADVPIEPRLSEQWFLKYPSVEASTRCVAEGRMKFHPDRWAKVYDHWLTNIQDWCISRQLWWGHRVPVWYPKPGAFTDAQLHELLQSPNDNYQDFVSPERDTILIWIAPEPPPEPEKWQQDPDVLDTWFSSWLWPFATMGWPEQTETLKKFYPTTDLVTGPDIIFFWVARMIMAGYEYTGDLPFRNVYFTGIIRDKQGRKMSKTLGNSPDPLELIAKYGADALRFGTMRSAPLGQDVLFDEKDVELGRNFCNKLWNACRFRQMQGGGTETEINPALLTSDDKWILIRLDQAIREVSEALATYNFATAVQALYRFFWSEYCDWYVEASKAAFFGEDAALKANKLAVMDFVLGHTLRLFHPFLPFITEELWHGMGFNQDLPADQGARSLMQAPWPKPFGDEEKAHLRLDDAADQIAQAKYDLVSLGRGLKRDCKIDPAKRVRFVLRPAGQLPAAELEVLRLLLNAESLEVVDAAWKPEKGTPSARNPLGELFLPLTGLVDFAAERARLTKEAEKYRAEKAKVEAKLANPNFTGKVPASVLEEHRQRLVEWQTKLAQAERSLADLPPA
jgi:valyl-tRNA synthetase